ncbi:MAG: hypothetical protein WCS66_06395, partial [Bacteroidales bacterium]
SLHRQMLPASARFGRRVYISASGQGFHCGPLSGKCRSGKSRSVLWLLRCSLSGKCRSELCLLRCSLSGNFYSKSLLSLR